MMYCLEKFKYDFDKYNHEHKFCNNNGRKTLKKKK